MDTTSPPVLTQKLTKRFRHVTALDALDLRVEPGDVLALLGANGSGKSTTFRLLLNIYRPTSGEATLLGTPSTRLNGHNFKHVGYISEGQKMPKWMSVAGFLHYCSGFYPEWDAEMCNRLVQNFALSPQQKIKHLSRGQTMKVAVASTLPAHPELLLLDEPFSGLDVETRAQLSYLLKELAHQNGLAIIITTHDVEEVEPVANRLGILNHGRLQVNETLEHYLARHRLLVAHGIDLTELPLEIRSKYNCSPALTTKSKIFTECFDLELQSATLNALSAIGVVANFAPMTIRQILTAQSLPLK
jgi:ABC-2 type transport system ATP-binding protein